MLIPSHVFVISAASDNESSRYALNGVQLTRDADGTPHAVATDGRILVHATWQEMDWMEYPSIGVVESLEPVPGFTAIVPAKQWNEVVKKVPNRTPKAILRNVALDEHGLGQGLCMGTTDLETARSLRSKPIEGRFPRWQDVFPKYNFVNQADVEESDTLCDMAVKICLDAKMLGDIAVLVRKAAGSEGDGGSPVSLAIPLDRNKPVVIAARGDEGGYAEGVIMPIENTRWDVADKEAKEKRGQPVEDVPATGTIVEPPPVDDDEEEDEDDAVTTGVDAVIEEVENAPDDWDDDDVQMEALDAFLIEREDLANDAETIAPVSGPRCRTCGANAFRECHDGQWLVAFGTAYCPKCREQAEAELGLHDVEMRSEV